VGTGRVARRDHGRRRVGVVAERFVPIALFAYSRADYLLRSLECLERDRVPFIYAFSDGPRTTADASSVLEVRRILRSVKFCEVRLIERDENLGLSRSMIDGIGVVLQDHEAVIVLEDDVVCVPGTYEYLRKATEAYSQHPNVMTITGWTHPLVTPETVGGLPYFDGRGEGSWNFCVFRRSWEGIQATAIELLRECRQHHIDLYRYGTDIVSMAQNSRVRDIWAVRFVLLHFLKGGLSMRPPWSLVDHIGVDERSVNVKIADKFSLQPLRECPPLPERWPEPTEHPDCPRLWQRACGVRPKLRKRIYRFARRLLSGI